MGGLLSCIALHMRCKFFWKVVCDAIAVEGLPSCIALDMHCRLSWKAFADSMSLLHVMKVPWSFCVMSIHTSLDLCSFTHPYAKQLPILLRMLAI